MDEQANRLGKDQSFIEAQVLSQDLDLALRDEDLAWRLVERHAQGLIDYDIPQDYLIKYVLSNCDGMKSFIEPEVLFHLHIHLNSRPRSKELNVDGFQTAADLLNKKFKGDQRALFIFLRDILIPYQIKFNNQCYPYEWNVGRLAHYFYSGDSIAEAPRFISDLAFKFQSNQNKNWERDHRPKEEIHANAETFLSKIEALISKTCPDPIKRLYSQDELEILKSDIATRVSKKFSLVRRFRDQKLFILKEATGEFDRWKEDFVRDIQAARRCYELGLSDMQVSYHEYGRSLLKTFIPGPTFLELIQGSEVWCPSSKAHQAVIEFFSKLEEISFLIEDLNLENIIFDGNRLQIIDCGNFKRKQPEDYLSRIRLLGLPQKEALIKLIPRLCQSQVETLFQWITVGKDEKFLSKHWGLKMNLEKSVKAIRRRQSEERENGRYR